MIKLIMNSLFILLNIILILIEYKNKKDLFNPATLVLIFITFPFFLSTLNLSNMQVDEYSYITYIVVYSIVLCLSVFVLRPSKIYDRKEYNIIINKLNIFDIIFITFFIVYLFENILISGMLIPINYIKIIGDLHLESVPVISTMTLCLRNILPALYYFIYDNVKNKKYIVYSIVCFIIPLTRGSRSGIAIGIFTIVVYKFYKVSLKKIIISIVIAIITFNVFIYTGNQRLSKSYSEYIEFKNIPYINYELNELVAWYYGYFAISYYNFDQSLKNWMQDPIYFYGLANTSGLLSGVLKLNKIFPDYPMIEDFDSRRVHVSGAAITATAKYYYMVDFGIIGAMIMEYIYLYLLYKVYLKSSGNNYYRFLYSLLSIHILFYSLYSAFYTVYYMANIILLLMLKKFKFIE